MSSKSKMGVLLVNLGTPEAPDIQSIRRFLNAFLSDPDVVRLPKVLRWLLVKGFILPFRPYKIQKAYQAIWTKQGAPLTVHSQTIETELQALLGPEYVVKLGMRYGKPHLTQAFEQLSESHCAMIQVIPLFPQYAQATTGSIEKAITQHRRTMLRHSHRHILSPKNASLPQVVFLDDFFNDSGYIEAWADLIKPELERLQPDQLIMSYHGLPTQQLKPFCHIKNSPSLQPTPHCSSENTAPCPSVLPQPNAMNRYCYRAQCYTTSRLIAEQLGLNETQYTVSFQSRLGLTPWIQPYTEKILKALYEKGMRRIVVVCPSFVTDCLETLEEIGLRGKEQWQQLGGEALDLIPCLNAHPRWIQSLADFCTTPIGDRL